MKSIKQLLRQPMKTLTGIALVALAVAILCVCVGQAAAAANMRASLEESYHTVAIPTDKYQSGLWPQEDLDWLEQFIQEHPQLVLQDSYAGLTSAYIPQLQPDNYTDYYVFERDSSNPLAPTQTGAPYTGVMLEVELQPKMQEKKRQELEDGTYLVTMEIRGKIQRVLGLEAGYNDPTDFTALIYITLPLDQWEAMRAQLEVGERYLVRGDDYFDKDWALRVSIAFRDDSGFSADGYSAGASKGFRVPAFDPEQLHFIGNGTTEAEWWAWIVSGKPLKNVAYYTQYYTKDDGTEDYYLKCFTAWEMVNSYNKVSFVLDDPTFGGSIVKLDGTAEEFLASQAGQTWSKTLANMQISNHAFPVVGVEELMYIAEFARQNAVLNQGRNFTPEELKNGGKVCVISEVLAEKNGLKLGDTISLQYYNTDEFSIADNKGIINFTAEYFTDGTSLSAEPESYTIVGIYSQKAIWGAPSSNLYAFTPNTIFVPKTAVTGEMDYTYMGTFRSLVLKNGSITQFSTILEANQMAGLFHCYDQGFEKLSDNLYGYEDIAQQALWVGITVYAIVLLLYIILFPCRQGKNITTMASLGATRWEKLRFVNSSSLGILLPGTAIGIALGISMRQEVMDALASSANVVLPLEMDVKSLLLVGLLQLAAVVLVVFLLSVPLTRNKSLMKRMGLLEYFRQLRKVPLNTWVVAGFGLVIAMVLCGLHASNQAELENYEITRKEIPVTLTVTNLQGDQTENLKLEPWVSSVLAGYFDWGLSDYLKDVQIECIRQIETIGGQQADSSLCGMLSIQCAPEILPITNGAVTWFDGYDESAFSGKELVCIVPEGYTEDTQLELYFKRDWVEVDSMGLPVASGTYEYSCTLTVVGTYTTLYNTRYLYCPYYVTDQVNTKLRVGSTLDSASAVLKDNDQLEEFLEVAYKFFLQPGMDTTPSGLKKYGLLVDTDALEKAEIVLQNSITINRISTYLVFILSAAASFFLGFLMIRSRKREIILMRTLGKPNWRIYVEFAMEQMLRVLLGVAVGGAVFRWQPVQRLELFVAVYFVGLSAALILFLNSKLITNMKEDE